MSPSSRPSPLDAERAAHARRRHDGVCGVRPGAGAYGTGGEDDEGVEGFSSFLLDEKGTKNQGRHHRTHRTKRALPRHVGQAHAPSPVEGGRSPEGGVNDEVFRRVVLRDFFIFAVCTNRIVQSSIKFP